MTLKRYTRTRRRTGCANLESGPLRHCTSRWCRRLCSMQFKMQHFKTATFC